MERDSLVAINIVNAENKLLNKSGVPMLYYWDGTIDIIESLSNDTEFIDYVKTLIIKPEDYLNINICYFYFQYNEKGDEVYSDLNVKIHNLIGLDKFDSEGIVLSFIEKHFKVLYKNSFKQIFDVKEGEYVSNICEMYRAIKSKFKERISKTTIVNWVRSVLYDVEHFNNTNIDFIINKLNQILKAEE